MKDQAQNLKSREKSRRTNEFLRALRASWKQSSNNTVHRKLIETGVWVLRKLQRPELSLEPGTNFRMSLDSPGTQWRTQLWLTLGFYLMPLCDYRHSCGSDYHHLCQRWQSCTLDLCLILSWDLVELRFFLHSKWPSVSEPHLGQTLPWEAYCWAGKCNGKMKEAEF